MKKIIIFGAGATGRRLFDILSNDSNINILCFVDNDAAKWGTSYNKTKICSPEILKEIEFDTLYYGTHLGYEQIEHQLSDLGIYQNKINKDYICTIYNARRIFVSTYANHFLNNVSGSIAEVGVYQGDFAKYLNNVFSDNDLYLFDTFEGFDEKDFAFESDESLTSAEYFKQVTVNNVLNAMPNPEKCIIKQGYFPETAAGIEQSFLFVSLDADLYKPTFEGLKYFYPRLVNNGCILVHDYYTPAYPNVKKAVSAFEKEFKLNLIKIPIGDDLSIAIIKK